MWAVILIPEDEVLPAASAGEFSELPAGGLSAVPVAAGVDGICCPLPPCPLLSLLSLLFCSRFSLPPGPFSLSGALFSFCSGLAAGAGVTGLLLEPGAAVGTVVGAAEGF